MPIFQENHPRLNGFNDYYRKNIEPELKAFESMRQKAFSVLWFAMVTLIFVFLLWCFYAGEHINNLNATLIMLVFIGIIGIGYYWGYQKAGRVTTQYHDFVALKISQFFKLHYRRQPEIDPVAYFQELKLLPDHDNVRIEDEIFGHIEATYINVVEAHLKKRRVITHKSGKKTETYITNFRGLLVEATFPKNFRGRTIIASDERKVTNYFNAKGVEAEKIALGDSKFERHFEVYSTDPIEARYLLTPSFMDRVVELSSHCGHGIQLAFDDHMLIMTVNKNKNMFQAGSRFSKLTDGKHIRAVLKEIYIVFDIIETLNLNNK